MAGVTVEATSRGRHDPSGSHADGLLWDVCAPPRPIAIPGVQAAGFTDRGVTPSRLRLIPHPALTLILVFDGSIAVENGAGDRLRGSLVLPPGYGHVLEALRLDTFRCLQVRLSPTVAKAVIGCAMAELDGGMELDTLWGRDAARLAERLGDRPGWAERFDLIERWLAERISADAAATPEIQWAWNRITETRGSVRIERLADDLGWSRRRLWERFRAQLGITPKAAARLVRFDHAVHRLSSGLSPARVAAESGFADQAHLSRDVSSYTGLTPSTVGAEPFLAVDGPAWGWPSTRRSG